MRLQGDIPEKPPVELPAPLGSDGPRLTIPGVWTTLKKAAADSNIKAIVLEPESLSVGWAKLEEMRSDIEQFRKSGKPVYAYLRTPGGREYYLASAADLRTPGGREYYLASAADRVFLGHSTNSCSRASAPS